MNTCEASIVGAGTVVFRSHHNHDLQSYLLPMEDMTRGHGASISVVRWWGTNWSGESWLLGSSVKSSALW